MPKLATSQATGECRNVSGKLKDRYLVPIPQRTQVRSMEILENKWRFQAAADDTPTWVALFSPTLHTERHFACPWSSMPLSFYVTHPILHYLYAWFPKVFANSAPSASPNHSKSDDFRISAPVIFAKLPS